MNSFVTFSAGVHNFLVTFNSLDIVYLPNWRSEFKIGINRSQEGVFIQFKEMLINMIEGY